MNFCCPYCKVNLRKKNDGLYCSKCYAKFSTHNGFLCFLQSPPHKEEICHQEEIEGEILRAWTFFIPWLKKNFGRSAKILDAGCGAGGLVKELRSEGYEAYGIDLGGGGYSNSWDNPEYFFFADGCYLPFPNNLFDVVISFGVIEHVGENEKKEKRNKLRNLYIQEAIRVLKKGGVFFLIFPNGAFPFDFCHFKYERLQMGFHLFDFDGGFAKTFLKIFIFDNCPSFRQIRKFIPKNCEVKFLSPLNILQLRAISTTKFRYFIPLAKLYFRLLKMIENTRFQKINSTFLNPLLAIQIKKPEF